MTGEQQVICKLLAKALFGRKFEPEEEISWADVYQECIRQTVIPATAPAVPAQAPLEIRMKWINAAGVHAASNQRVQEGHFAIHRLLTENRIPYTILKGMATAQWYPDPEMRTLGDVDFLVRKEDAKRCGTLLEEKGYRSDGKHLPYEWGYAKDGVVFELHLEIPGIPGGKTGEITEGYFNDILSDSAPAVFGKETAVFPGTFHHGLILLVHTAKHMVSEGVGLRQLCDWAVFAGRLGETLPELLEGALKEIGIWSFAQVLSAACVKYLGMPAFSWIQETDDAFLDAFMEDFLRKGNLRMTGDSGVDSIFVEKTGEGGVAEEAMLPRLYKNLAQKVQYKWPVMKRARILIPFGILAMCTLYFFGMLSGKYKKIHLGKLTAESEKRRKLYGELRLFQEDEKEQ